MQVVIYVDANYFLVRIQAMTFFIPDNCAFFEDAQWFLFKRQEKENCKFLSHTDAHFLECLIYVSEEEVTQFYQSADL